MASTRARMWIVCAAVLGAGACTSGQVGQLPITSVNPATSSKLEFKVGWVTTYPANGNLPEYDATGYGINLVATFRQSNGKSAVLSDTAEVDVPAPFATQYAAPIPGASPNPPDLQLGSSVAVYGSGINEGSGGLENGIFQSAVGTGGPPAFPVAGDSTSATQTFYEGYNAQFPLPLASPNSGMGLPLTQALQTYPGSYTLNVTIPTGQTSSEIVSAKAGLSGKPLPAIAPPQFDADGTSGGTVSITIPAGVTETIVTILANACPQQSTAPGATPAPNVFSPETYTLVSHKSGPATDQLSLPDFVTPVGGVGPYLSICPAKATTGGLGTLYVVGFDYPAYESVYPQNFSESPTLVGAAGQTDITLGPAITFSIPTAAP